MNKYNLILIFLSSLISLVSYGQILFVGFDQEQCGLITNHGYTYENISMMCGSHSSGYKIYLNGEKKFEKCIEFGGCSILDMMFINETTGFLIERNSNGHSIYKTENSAVNWTSIGGGAPTYLGFYLVNANTGYLITTWDSPLNIYITRVSDIRHYYYSDSVISLDTVINDTIFGVSFCDIDTLGFKIKNSNDTIDYKIYFQEEPLSVRRLIINTDIQFYPIPCMNFIYIRDEVSYKNSKYKIIDLSGKILRTGILYNSQINIMDLKNGIYTIQITTANKEYIGKILKQ